MEMQVHHQHFVVFEIKRMDETTWESSAEGLGRCGIFPQRLQNQQKPEEQARQDEALGACEARTVSYWEVPRCVNVCHPDSVMEQQQYGSHS